MKKCVVVGFRKHAQSSTLAAWIQGFKESEEPLPEMKLSRNKRKSKSRSDRRSGLEGKQHRIARASRAKAMQVSASREADFVKAERRKVEQHRIHHVAVANATTRAAISRAREAIAQFPY